MRSLYAVLLMVMLFLTACQSSNEIKLIESETTDFDLNTAYEMVKKKEKMILDFAMLDKVTQKEFADYEAAFIEEFGETLASQLLEMLIIHDMDAPQHSDLFVQKYSLYPTVFHKGVTITQAYITKNIYEHDFFNSTLLTIREQYTEANEDLKNWYREYIFKLNENDEWELYQIPGIWNLTSDGYNINYLELIDYEE